MILSRGRTRWPAALLPVASLPGLVLATLFLVASLMPSLVPRSPLIQGALSGFSIAAGYGLGLVFGALWRMLALPVPRGRLLRVLWGVIGVACLLATVIGLRRATDWQNGLRALMEMAPVETMRPAIILALALSVFLLLLWLARLVRVVAARLRGRLARFLPGPQAAVLAVLVTAVLFWNIGNGVILRAVMAALDRSYAAYDAIVEKASPRPTDPLKAGGPGSLLDWAAMGRAGREMIAAGPDRAAIAAVAGAPAAEPLRVYVGLNAAPDPEARAALALAELQRIGGFDRSALVIATPTGTGWIDPEGQRALEYVLRGDVATVAVQYSYLASWIALLADRAYGVETARAVFAAIYGHWRDLPPAERPRLYLYGLSLGALNSDLSHDLHQVVGDPFDGALWVGPPFSSPTWNAVTRTRNPGSPAWLPAYRDGSAIRFASQFASARDSPAPWGGFRIVYLQYASDAVTFFDPGALWRPPAWLDPPRGPDVSEDLVWLPVVTALQLGVDLMTAVLPPLGYGHSYRFDHYVDAWAALTDAPGWTAEGLAALKAQARPPR